MDTVQRLYDTQNIELRGFVDLCKTFEKNQVERVTKWKQEAEELVKNLEHKRHELSKCELELKNIRDKLFKCENSRWIPEEDQSIQHTVQDLQLTIRSWAKDCSVKSFQGVLNTEKLHQHSGFLHRVSDYSGYQEAQQIQGLEHPFLLLAAFLSEVLRATIWHDPLFHFRDPVTEKSHSFAGRLNKMLFEMGNLDERKANSLRKEIIRHEFPDSASPLTKDTQVGELLVPKSVSEDVLRRVYNDLETRFLNAIPRWMLKAMDDEEARTNKEDLAQIFTRAGNLHFRLLTQQARFFWIPPRTQVGKRFKAG
ncbi:hypothetical protein JOL62DRAFT_614734 [Phyllosticta paracitricarpa]|uniref:Uncharacterized protein n=1 Tax=Phyllosticta paracitricarpa TaxID=2016321 RepID=A0ABR1N0F2_9PEZI